MFVRVDGLVNALFLFFHSDFFLDRYYFWICGASSFWIYPLVPLLFSMYWACLPLLVLFISIIVTYQKRSFLLVFILLLKMNSHIIWEFLFHHFSLPYKLGRCPIGENGGNGFCLAIAQLDSLFLFLVVILASLVTLVVYRMVILLLFI